MKKYIVALLCIISALGAYAQGIIKGSVKDIVNGETIIGAQVMYATGKGAVTDLDGNFIINNVENGKYNVIVQFSGYQTETRAVEVNNNTISLDFQLKPNTLKEVEIVADIAISRQTPVAFSNIPAEKIKEQLGSQDLPMILNTTPGVYATNQGGGDGDSRINIRGFSQRNIAVLVDGVPMNDMENGQVYWSNWFGLDNITRTMQVQRGLGASKLSLPSVGGTMNIITSGFDAKRALTLKQEYGNNLNLRTILSYTSGELKGGWAITAAGSFKRNDGWVDQTWSKMWFYYVKVDKKLGKHMLSVSAFGAPQAHAQRSNRQSIARYSHDLAESVGVDTTVYSNFLGKEFGPRFNQEWGTLVRHGGPDSLDAREEIVNTRVNFFHKPVVSLRHTWQANDKFFLSNIAYASFGNGGGTSLVSTVSGNGLYDQTTGQTRLQLLYNSNVNGAITPGYGRQSRHYLRASYNNHQWYGLLSTFNYRPTSAWTVSGGIDVRTYRAQHYQQIYDYLGGDYVIDNNDENSTESKKTGNAKVGYNYDGIINWAGAFGLAEYKGGNWSAFLNLSGTGSFYQRVDYFLMKDSITGKYPKTPVRSFGSFISKGGANWNITEQMNLYANVGFFSRAPRFTNVFTNKNREYQTAKNEKVYSAELGYNYNAKKFALNINTYYTVWKNRPFEFLPSITYQGDPYTLYIQSMDARHLGIEFDGVYRIRKNLQLDAMFSWGDWIWTSQDNAFAQDDQGNNVATIQFDARGVKVSDAAQMTAAAGLRYEPIKRLYIKAQFNYYGKNYANFDPTNLYQDNAGRQSWKMPDYWLMDAHIGYGFYVGKKVRFDLRGSLLNVFNKIYISDATNNFSDFVSAFPNNSFNSTTAAVYVGMGRRFLTSLTITY